MQAPVEGVEPLTVHCLLQLSLDPTFTPECVYKPSVGNFRISHEFS
jgi:hypothetical protein